jgi:tetratricopeptide (TPR) repeat protein
VTKRRPRRLEAPPSGSPTSRGADLLAFALVFAAAAAVFWPSVGYAFLNWDDPVYILQNPWIRALTWENVRGVFTHPYFQNYLPLHLLSYMLDHALWGLKASGYHLTSVLLHAINSVLCVAVVRRMGGSRTVATLAGLFFAVHPCHVEAVAWVSSRKEVLSTTFMLLSLLFYLGARRGSDFRPIPFVSSILFFLLAMLSKVSVVVLPAFLLLVDWMPEPKGARTRPSLAWAVATKVPYAIAGAALILVNSAAQVTAQAAYAHDPFRYLVVKGQAVWNYAVLLLGFGGNPDYDLPSVGTNPAVLFFQLAGLIALPLAAYLLLRAKKRLPFLGVSWTFLALLPALLFPLVTYMADRYLYAPSLGFCWALAAGVVGAKATLRTTAAGALAVILVAWFTFRTLQYAPVWRDSEALWTFAMTKSQDYRVFNNLAQVRTEQKRWGEAERLLRQGATAENVTSHQSLGVLYYTLHRYEEALQETDRALEIQSRKRPDAALEAELHFNRGATLWVLGKSEAAAEEWRTALRDNPSHAQAKEWLRIATQR